jgi:hypothetical protein
MKINFNLPLKQYDGEPYLMNGEPLTLCKAIQTALITSLESDRALTPTQMYDLGQIGQIAQNDGSVTTNQIGQIKDRLAKVFVPALVYQMFNLLEGE